MGKIEVNLRLLASVFILVNSTLGIPVSGQDTTYGAFLIEGPERIEGLPGSKVEFQVRVFYEGPEIRGNQVSMSADNCIITGPQNHGGPTEYGEGDCEGRKGYIGGLGTKTVEATIPEVGCIQARIFFVDGCMMREGGAPILNSVVEPISISTKIPDLSELHLEVCSAYPFLRGDCNVDGNIDLSDAIGIIFFQFMGDAITCVDAADVDDDSLNELADVIYLLTHLFLEGPAPKTPYPACGIDPTIDDLDCQEYLGCE